MPASSASSIPGSFAGGKYGLTYSVMVQKSQGQPPFGGIKFPVDNGKNYRPQLVNAGFFSINGINLIVIYIYKALHNEG